MEEFSDPRGGLKAGEVSRRSFLSAAGLGTATLVVDRLFGRGAMAGPFPELCAGEFPIPADKRLDAAWVKSLFARGEPEVYSSARDELKWIGLPIGGVCCGQVYLGGDGRLWHWDVFNLSQEKEWSSTAGPLYAKPAEPRSPVKLSFHLEYGILGSDVMGGMTLGAGRGADIEFRGQYPIGITEYRRVGGPFEVTLEAYSPFIPLNTIDSSLPLTVLSYTVRNSSAEARHCSLSGLLQNPVCLGRGRKNPVQLRNRAVRRDGIMALVCSAEPLPQEKQKPLRPEIVFEDWEKGTYEGWRAEGTAFGDCPRNLGDIAGYQGDLNAQGRWVVNTHETRHGEDVVKADEHLGRLISRDFIIERNYIRFRIGGGNHPGQTCMRLFINDVEHRSATGHNSNRMRLEHFDVRDAQGVRARLEIVDDFSGGWGQIGIDDIVFTDLETLDLLPLEAHPDYGTMALAVLDPGGGADVMTGGFGGLGPDGLPRDHVMRTGVDMTGRVRTSLSLAPGESKTVTFLVAWHFPNPPLDELAFIEGIKGLHHHYAARFDGAIDVVAYTASNFDRLSAQTRVWRDTWRDSTLPHWFLERTFINNSIAATVTCLRFDNGRFYGWEGTHCCAGTCQHVWQYAQGLARVFPELERSAREMVDYGLAFHEDTGAVDYRAEADRRVAHDGLAGTIMRVYREHTMSADDAFLKRIWPRVRKSIEHLMREDRDGDGLLEGEQYNTLDAAWYGPMGWISSLYLGAVRAGEAMAREMGDQEFAKKCGAICERGSKSMVEKLYNGEYFIHLADPKHPEANSTNDGCHIDQVFGQSWAWQVGLDRVVPERECKSALASLWKYSFAPDVGVYRDALKDIIKGGRWYAMPGEAGLLMCTFPKGGAERATAKGGDAWAAGYFNECMHGFEYQVAAHMMWEGMALESLAITRSLHDRYHPSKRNPYNEIECSNHYARSMASYGVFIAACGFEHHGPRGHIGFSPRMTPDDFRAPFTACEGWGTFSQKRGGGKFNASIDVKWGRLRLKTVALAPGGADRGAPTARLGGAAVKVNRATRGEKGVVVQFGEDVVVEPGKVLEIEFA